MSMPMDGAPRGGLVVDTRKGRRFVGAEQVVSISWITEVAPVPGMLPAAEGIAIAEDRVVTVLPAGEQPGGLAVVCEVDGGWVALMGLRVVACGRFAAHAGAWVQWQGEPVEPLDLRAMMLEAETAIWRTRQTRDEGTGR